MNGENPNGRLKTLFGLFILVVVVLTLYGRPEWVPLATEIFVIVLTSTLFSIIAEALVSGLTGDALKVITIPIEIFGINFSVTAFAIAAFVVKFWLFGGV